MRSRWALLTACVWLAAAPATVQAKNRDAVGACFDAVTRFVRNRNAQIERVESLGGANVSQVKAGVNVTGAGQAQTRDGSWTKFSYTCTYDPRTGRTSGIDARAEKKGKKHHDKHRDKHRDNSAAIKACFKSVTRFVSKRDARIKHVQSLGGEQLRKVSDAEKRVTGYGQAQTRDGKWTRFTYQCVYNFRTGQTSGIDARAEK